MDKIGRYQLLKKVGQGAMGVVYKAMDPSIERIVAVKTMSADLDSDPELRARFFREARSAGQLSHKNIVTIYDLGEEAGKAFMAMEFLDGEDIKQLITRGAPVPIESKVAYMIEVLEGLAHAHQKGIFHRDVKPGNIYITNSGQVKILDFGLARMASSDMTKTGLVMGTPNYMSPEQINGTAIDHRSDIFSAGATFYELLTTRKPFYSSSLQSTFFKILQQDPEPLETIDPSIPPEFSTVLLKAMAKSPAARYQSVEEMLQALERFPKMLEQRRRKARGDAKKAIDRLDGLITENSELLGGSSPEYDDLRQSVPAIAGNRSNDDTIRTQNTEPGLLAVLEIRDRANREYQRLELLLQKRREAATLLREAASAEVEGQLEKALELVEKVAADIPESAAADLFSKRIRLIVSDREKEQAFGAIANLEILISENRDCLQSEEHLNPADLKAAILSSPEPARAADADATVLSQPLKSDSEIIRIRDKANAELARLAEVIARQREGQKRLEQEKTLRLTQLLQDSRQLHNGKMFQQSLARLDELLAIDPQNAPARTFRSQVTADIENEKRKQEQIQKAAALLQTASAQYSARKLADAHKSLVDALALNPQYPEAAKLLAEVEQAQEQARFEEKKRNAEQAATQSRQALHGGNLEQARHEAERALDFDPDGTMVKAAFRDIAQTEENIRKLLQEGLSLLQDGDEVKAAARADAIFTLDRQSSAGRELKEKIDETRVRRERDEREKKERIARTLAQAREAEAGKRLHNAREFAASVLKEEPAHAEAQAVLQRIQEIEAREELERRARELLSSADRLAKDEDFQGAISLIQKADAVVTSLESVKQSLQKYQQARAQQEARQKAEREKRERIVATLSEARTAQSSGELEKALSLTRNVIGEDPAHKEARELLKNIEEAIEARRQREETEKRARELLAQAEALAAKGKYQEALAGLQKAESRVSSLPPIRQRIEEYQKQAKAQDEAKERARRVQKHLEATRNLFAQGDFSGCEREIDQLLAVEPGHAGALDLRTQARAQIQKQREAELREQQLKKERLQKLLEDARGALEKQDPAHAGALLAEAVTLGAAPSETAALKKRIDKLQRSQKKQQEAAASTATGPARRSRALPVGIGLAVLIAIGLSIWATRPPAYQQQITAAQTYLQQNDFSKAIETLQQVPQGSSLYGQAQTLLTEARNAEKKKNIDSLVAEASAFRQGGRKRQESGDYREITGTGSCECDWKVDW